MIRPKQKNQSYTTFSGEKCNLYDQLLYANEKTVTIYCFDFLHSYTAHHITKTLCTINRIKFEL